MTNGPIYEIGLSPDEPNCGTMLDPEDLRSAAPDKDFVLHDENRAGIVPCLHEHGGLESTQISKQKSSVSNRP